MVLVRNKRRALSTVVTTTIMLTAVAIIGAGVVAWANTNSRTFETILVSSASDKLNKINEMPKIENVVLSTGILGVNKINITVSNVGTVGFNVLNIVVSSTGNCNTYPTYSTSVSNPTCPNTVIVQCSHPPYDTIYCKSIIPQSSRWYLIQYGPGNAGVLTNIAVTTNRTTTVTTQVMK